MKLLTTLRTAGRLETTFLLFFSSLFCLGLSLTRCFFSHSKIFLFLNWNLFLAFIPWLVTTFLMLRSKKNRGKFPLLLPLLTWIVFFPNAPYILTDLFHLRYKSSVPVWFDTVLILSYAWTGSLFGFVSLLDIESLLNFKKKSALLVSTVLLFAAGFGIYLGRFLRWNSWDILQDPGGLLGDVTDRFIHPFHHPRTWMVTFAIGMLLNLMYWSIKALRSGARLSTEPGPGNPRPPQTTSHHL